MNLIESEIRRVIQDHQKITSNVRTEEAKIDVLNREIKTLEDRIRSSSSSSVEEPVELERQRMQNLLRYQSTLINRAASRTELLRALHEDLLLLFLRRKELRLADGTGGSSIDVAPNVSLSSGLSSGDDDSHRFPNDCPVPGSVDILRMSNDHDNLDEVTTEQEQLPLGLKMLQINMNEDACLTPEGVSEYGDLSYQDNLLDNIAISVLDPNANVSNIFKEAMETSSPPCPETQVYASAGSKKIPKKTGRMAYRSLARHLTVDFDEAGNPTGPNAGAFKRSINSYVCQLLPVRFKQIGDVPVEDYKSVLNVLTERYNFDLNRSYTRKKISSCYRQHKYKLLVQVKKDLEVGSEPQRPSYVKKEDWDAFVAKTKDEEFDRISKKNKASRSQQSSLNKKCLSHGSVHKRKMKGLEQGSVDDCIWLKEHKMKRSRLRKLSAGVDDSHDVVENTDFHVDQEMCSNAASWLMRGCAQGFGSEQSLKSYPHFDTINQYEYWNST